MPVTKALERRVSSKVALVIGLLLLAFVVFLVVIALMPPQELPRDYRIETLDSGRTVLLDAAGNILIPDRDIELERVSGRWIIVNDAPGSVQAGAPMRYYLVDSLTGDVTESTELVTLLRVMRDSP